MGVSGVALAGVDVLHFQGGTDLVANHFGEYSPAYFRPERESTDTLRSSGRRR
jgi:hypothetical protein